MHGSYPEGLGSHPSVSATCHPFSGEPRNQCPVESIIKVIFDDDQRLNYAEALSQLKSRWVDDCVHVKQVGSDIGCVLLSRSAHARAVQHTCPVAGDHAAGLTVTCRNRPPLVSPAGIRLKYHVVVSIAWTKRQKDSLPTGHGNSGIGRGPTSCAPNRPSTMS